MQSLFSREILTQSIKIWASIRKCSELSNVRSQSVKFCLKKHQNCTLFIPFATDGTQKYHLKKNHLEGKRCPDTYEQRDYEAVAG